MPDTVFYTVEAAIAKANVIKTSIAVGSKLRLFKSDLVPNQFTTRAQLIANECNFDGYTAGGYTCAPFTGPLLPSTGGAQLQSLLVDVAYGPAGDPPVGNVVGGYWIEDDSDPDPLVRVVGAFSPFRNAGAVGDGFSIVTQLTEGKNAAPTAPS